MRCRASAWSTTPTSSSSPIDSQVLEQLYWCGEQGWEPELLPWWRAFCRTLGSVLELGTNVGYFAVQGGRAAPGVRYVAVEPHPVSAEACRTHLALNGVTSVELIQAAAVGDPAVSSVPLLVPADQAATPTVAFLSLGHRAAGGHDPGRVAVLEVPTVDVRRLLDGVDLIKMDVEGQEHVLLAAIRPYLRERRPTLFVEVLAGTVQLRALLAELCATDGYRCYALSRQGPVELDGERLATVRSDGRVRVPGRSPVRREPAAAVRPGRPGPGRTRGPGPFPMTQSSNQSIDDVLGHLLTDLQRVHPSRRGSDSRGRSARRSRRPATRPRRRSDGWRRTTPAASFCWMSMSRCSPNSSSSASAVAEVTQPWPLGYSG